jgi:hypothetical protein
VGNEHGHLALPLRDLYEAQLIRDGWVKFGPNCWSKALDKRPIIKEGSLERISPKKSVITRIISALRRWFRE